MGFPCKYQAFGSDRKVALTEENTPLWWTENSRVPQPVSWIPKILNIFTLPSQLGQSLLPSLHSIPPPQYATTDIRMDTKAKNQRSQLEQDVAGIHQALQELLLQNPEQDPVNMLPSASNPDKGLQTPLGVRGTFAKTSDDMTPSVLTADSIH